MTETLNLVALCALGAEKVLAQELRHLGLTIRGSGAGNIGFAADLEGAYRALMELRTADRVLWEAAAFPARDFDQLYDGIRGAPWERFVKPDMGIVVDKVRAQANEDLRGQSDMQAVINKAVADRLCAQFHLHRLPESPSPALIRVHIKNNEVHAMLDLAGEPLFKRGYRKSGGAAPLRETTAAALLLLAGWKRKYPLYDPFCGSGTITIEAALYAWDIAPGLKRGFALSRMACADKSLEARVRGELANRSADAIRDEGHNAAIYGSDSDPQALVLARHNMLDALSMGFSGSEGIKNRALKSLTYTQCAMEEARVPAELEGKTGSIITNPPWGKRLEVAGGAEGLYRAMGALDKRFPGWDIAVISDSADFEEAFGRKADNKRSITNGALPCYFYQYKQYKNQNGLKGGKKCQPQWSTMRERKRF
jgi:putative N6-adenine-specific DNA methylase